MDDYTPTDEQVRAAYVRGMRDTFVAAAADHEAEFDRWLAQHDREVAAKALRVFASRANDAGVLRDPVYWFPVRDSARAEADRIERGES